MAIEQVKVMDQCMGENFAIYHGDSTEVLKGIPDNSVGLTMHSPPFASLYTYSNSERDLGNCKTHSEFYEHFDFIVSELHRVCMPGRISAFHCMNLPTSKERDGIIGMTDFRGKLIAMFERNGFVLHSEAVIWKDPLIAATRTKALGLMHKQLMKDSAMCRMGIPDYLIAMRKRGDNPVPIPHPNGLDEWVGEEPPVHGVLSHERWQRYASPIWMDIDPGDTLNGTVAREHADERHICPLQLSVIERAMWLWSKEGDVVLSPFLGIGSEGHVALKMGRKFVGCELKKSYYVQACKNLKNAELHAKSQMDLFATAEAKEASFEHPEMIEDRAARIAEWDAEELAAKNRGLELVHDSNIVSDRDIQQRIEQCPPVDGERSCFNCGRNSLKTDWSHERCPECGDMAAEVMDAG